MGLEEKVTILDEYSCDVLNDRIRIKIISPRDPSLADIMSELHDSEGRMHFDGSYYMFNGRYDIDSNETGWYLDLYIN